MEAEAVRDPIVRFPPGGDCSFRSLSLSQFLLIFCAENGSCWSD